MLVLNLSEFITNISIMLNRAFTFTIGRRIRIIPQLNGQRYLILMLNNHIWTVSLRSSICHNASLRDCHPQQICNPQAASLQLYNISVDNIFLLNTFSTILPSSTTPFGYTRRTRCLNHRLLTTIRLVHFGILQPYRRPILGWKPSHTTVP